MIDQQLRWLEGHDPKDDFDALNGNKWPHSKKARVEMATIRNGHKPLAKTATNLNYPR